MIRKRMNIVTMLVVFFASAMFSHAGVLKVTPEVSTIIQNLSDSDFFPPEWVYTQRVEKIRNYNANRLFQGVTNLGIVSKSTKIEVGGIPIYYSAAFINVTSYTSGRDQCTDAVWGLTNTTTCADWSPGTQVTATSAPNIPFGTVIATFDNYGNYDNGHTAIFLEGNSSYIVVLDQNWKLDSTDPGVVARHRILFSNTGSTVSNPTRYYVVER